MPRANMTTFKSNFEKTFHSQTKLPYETTRLEYVKHHKYTPDFQLGPKTFVETKGKLTGADRTKHLLIKVQHPDVRVIFVFMAPNNKLSKSSKTTYAMWAEKNGFEWHTLESFKRMYK